MNNHAVYKLIILLIIDNSVDSVDNSHLDFRKNKVHNMRR